MQFARKLHEIIGAKTKTVRSQARRDLAAPHESNRHAMIVSGGLIALYRDGGSTQRRLVALRYPGEVVQPHESGLRVHSMSGSAVLLIDTDVFEDALFRHAELNNLARDASVRAELIAYEWLMRDAMDSSRRAAHFLCEHAMRGHGAHSDCIALELTQQQIGEITAQTPVNVNRVLRSLEKQGLFVPIGDRQYRVDWPELRRMGHFDTHYLDPACGPAPQD